VAIVLLLLQHKFAFCSSSKLTILRASSTQHSPSSVSTMLGPEWFFKPYTKAYNTPSNEYFQVRQSLSEYLNMITSSPLFQESTHPGVAPALCSTLGTTLYFSVSLSLLVSRVQVALHLHLWGQPIKGWSIYVLILSITMSLPSSPPWQESTRSRNLRMPSAPL
jgi:hypothetical protein